MTYPIQILLKKIDKSEEPQRPERKCQIYHVGQHMCNRNEPQREKRHRKEKKRFEEILAQTFQIPFKTLISSSIKHKEFKQDTHKSDSDLNTAQSNLKGQTKT